MKIVLICLISLLFTGCSAINDNKDAYIISSKQNDIKTNHPKLWSWIELQALKASVKESKAKELYPQQLNYARGLKIDAEQIERREILQGVWVDCNGAGLGSVYKFSPEGKFNSFEKKFADSNCTSTTKAGLAGFGLEFNGYYIIGNQLASNGSGEIYELDFVHTDNWRTQSYDESKIYYKVVQVNGNEMLFSNRSNPSVYLSPETRNLKLDRKKFTYLKCNCKISVE